MASAFSGWFRAAVCAWLPLLLFLALGAPAAAAEHPAREAARALFREGIGLAREGELERAIVSFERSLELFPHAATYYNLGLAEHQRGRSEAAARHLRNALARAAADPDELPLESRRVAEERLAAIEELLAAERAPDAAAVGAPALEGAGTPAHAPASAATASAPAPAPVLAPAPQAAVVPVPAAPAAPTTPASLPPATASGTPRESSSTRSPLLVPALGVAVAGGISTIVFGSLALAQQAKVDRLCPDPSRCPAGTSDEADKLATLAVAADVSLAVALAGTGLCVYAWFSPREATPKAARIGFSGAF